MSDLLLSVGKKALAKLTPVLADETAAQYYQAGSLQVSISDTTVAKVFPGSTERYAVIVALCPGTATITYSAISHLGNPITKTHTLEVSAFEAVDIKVEYTML